MSNPIAKAQPLDIMSCVSILYEDQDCIVLNKPASLMVHSDGRDKGPFLADWVKKHFPEVRGVGEPMNSPDGASVNRSGIVHRLDRETSGAIIVAKNQNGYLDLKRQFQERTVKKKYIAFLWGEMSEDFGTISRPIGRSKNDFRKYSAQRGAKGQMREAETYWSLISNFKYNDQSLTETDIKTAGNNFSLVEAEPKTGRTHQIRVHFNAIHHPVVGDRLYAPKKPMVLGFQRMALHSRVISFENMARKRVEIMAPLPADFIEACNLAGIRQIR